MSDLTAARFGRAITGKEPERDNALLPSVLPGCVNSQATSFTLRGWEMKKTVTKDVTLCDGCKKEGYAEQCLGCGLEHCWECQRTLGVEYKHSVYFSGGGDGYFCLRCDKNPPENVVKIWAAYNRIQTLRRERESWGNDFEIRAKSAEEEIKKLRERGRP